MDAIKTEKTIGTFEDIVKSFDTNFKHRHLLAGDFTLCGIPRCELEGAGVSTHFCTINSNGTCAHGYSICPKCFKRKMNEMQTQ